MNRTSSLSICALLVVGAIAYLLTRETESIARSGPPLVISTPSADESHGRTDLEAARAQLAAELPPRSATLESVLQQHWGSQWPLVREKMTKEGIDPDKPFVLQPWESVADDLRAQFLPKADEYARETKEFYLEWPTELDLKWLDDEFVLPKGFTESDLYRVEAIAGPFNTEIEAIADEYALLIAHVVQQKWDAGDFVRVPFSTTLVPDTEAPSDIFYASAMGSGSGWGVTMTLTRGEYPDIAALKKEMQAKQVERDRQIRIALGSWNK